MAKKKSKKDLKKELLNDDAPTLGIPAEVDLNSLMLKNKRWLAKLWVETVLPRTYHLYQINLAFNPQPYEDRIADLEAELDASLFKNEKGTRTQTDKNIKQIKDQMDRLSRECETINFVGMIDEIKYRDQGTVLVMRVPDDCIEPFNRQKHKMDLYLIHLKPVHEVTA